MDEVQLPVEMRLATLRTPSLTGMRDRNMMLWLRQDDIANGEAEATQSCPIALALHRHSNGLVWHVDSLVAEVDHGKQWFLGRDARAFVQRFDAGRRVEPGYVHLYQHRWAARIR